MMLPALRALFGLRRPPPAPCPPTCENDDLVVTDPRQVRSDLEDVASARRLVAWRSPDDELVGTGLLCVGPGASLELRASAGEAACWPEPPSALNATVSGQRGLLLFTLVLDPQSGKGVSRAAWPSHIIRMQSRRHYRVRGLQGPTHRVHLVLPGVAEPVLVRDISEGGVGFDLGGLPGTALPERIDGVRIGLDGELLGPALLHPVHQRVVGPSKRIGAQLLGLGEADTRALRRWMAVAQAVGVAPRQG